jgi:TetR/AcrR family transcriptional repressor of nem operon
MSALGRPKTFNHDHALNAAMSLFWDKGYEGSSLAELLAVMEVSRSTLYQSFGAKDVVFQQCLDRYTQGLLEALYDALAAAPSGRSFLVELLSSVASTAGTAQGKRSCLIVNSVGEFGTGVEVPGERLQKALDAVTELLVAAVLRAQQEGEIDVSESPVELAAYFHVAVSGLRTMIKAGASPESIESTVRRLLKAF